MKIPSGMIVSCSAGLGGHQNNRAYPNSDYNKKVAATFDSNSKDNSTIVTLLVKVNTLSDDGMIRKPSTSRLSNSFLLVVALNGSYRCRCPTCVDEQFKLWNQLSGSESLVWNVDA